MLRWARGPTQADGGLRLLGEAAGAVEGGVGVVELLGVAVQREGELLGVRREDGGAAQVVHAPGVCGDAGQAQGVEHQRAGEVRQEGGPEGLRLLDVDHPGTDEHGGGGLGEVAHLVGGVGPDGTP